MRWSWVTMTAAVPRLFTSRDDELHHLLAELGVERRGGLVDEHERRLVHQGAPDGHPLALAARHLPRKVVGPVLQTELVEQLVGPVRRLAPRP